MRVLGIDPGPLKSAYAAIAVNDGCMVLTGSGIFVNAHLSAIRYQLGELNPDLIAIEQIRNYGMPQSNTTLDTCEMVGAFKTLADFCDIAYALAPRKTIVASLCGSAKAGDSNVRSGVIDLLLPHYIEHDEKSILGTKKSPGPLYGFKGKDNNDKWAALAAAIYGARLGCE